jgi:hypothetical protein
MPGSIIKRGSFLLCVLGIRCEWRENPVNVFGFFKDIKRGRVCAAVKEMVWGEVFLDRSQFRENVVDILTNVA